MKDKEAASLAQEIRTDFQLVFLFVLMYSYQYKEQFLMYKILFWFLVVFAIIGVIRAKLSVRRKRTKKGKVTLTTPNGKKEQIII